MHVHLDASSLRNGLIGGLCIGASSSALLLLSGKTLGVSSIISAVARGRRGWELSFLAGTSLAGAGLALLLPTALGATTAVAATPVAAPLLLLGGVCIGFGTAEGSGCTSGHGVCGLGRLSPRSLVAVLSFMAAGSASAILSSSLSLTAAAGSLPAAFGSALTAAALPLALVAALGGVYAFCRPPSQPPTTPPQPFHAPLHAAALACGTLFGLGLGISGMGDPSKVRGFLNPLSASGWDPTLACVMGGAVTVTSLVFALAKSFRFQPPCAQPHSQPIAECFVYGPSAPRNLVIDAKLVRGAVLFGVGWGLSGMCPGPAFLAAAAGSHAAQLTLAGIVSGALLHDAVA